MTASQGDAGEPPLAETRIDSTRVYDGSFLQVWRDSVRLPDGAAATREYIRHPGAVMIVAVADDGRLVVERQHRYPLGRVLVEFPAGKVDPGETPAAAARRELQEETGYQAHEWARAGCLHTTAAYSDEAIDIWFARGLQPGPAQLDDGEFIEVCLLGVDDLLALALRGELTDAKTLAGLLWMVQWRSGAWAPAWQTWGPSTA